MRVRFRSADDGPARFVRLRMGPVLRSIVAVLGVLVTDAVPALADDYTLGELRIAHPYARPTPPGARTGSAYFTVRNNGTQADRLLHVASPAAQNVELHSMTMDGNLMKMRAIPALDIAAGATVTLGSGGYHVMLVNLAHPLAIGGNVPLTLTFERAGSIEVSAPVEAPNAGAEMAHRH
jgi:copper(I)-binding protein